MRFMKTAFMNMLEYILIQILSWLYPGIAEREIVPFVAWEDRKSSPTGGAATIAKAGFDAVEIELSTKTECVAPSSMCKKI